jgi:hypothetical protein
MDAPVSLRRYFQLTQKILLNPHIRHVFSLHRIYLLVKIPINNLPLDYLTALHKGYIFEVLFEGFVSTRIMLIKVMESF